MFSHNPHLPGWLFPVPASAAALLRGFRGRDVQNQSDHSLWIGFMLCCRGILLFSRQLEWGTLCAAGDGGSFVTTPCSSWMNLQVIQGRQVPRNRRWPRSAHRGRRLGLLVLLGPGFVLLLSPSLASPLRPRILGQPFQGLQSGQNCGSAW